MGSVIILKKLWEILTQLLCDYTKFVVGEIRTAHSEKILGFGTLLNIYSLAETGT